MRSVRSIRKLSYHSTVIVLILVLLASAAGVPMIAAAQEIDRAGNSGPGGTLPPDASLEEMAQLEDVEVRYQASYAHLATGDPSAVPDRSVAASDALRPESVTATHATYAWPFNVSFTLGHAIQSYQNYSTGTSQAYFHHGLDIMAPNGTDVFSRSGGQVVNVENYQLGNDLYWEVAVKDPEGYIWQYHHIDKNTIPQAIKDKFAQYQADPLNGGFIAPNTYIGDIVYWTVVSYNKRFNHIHLNILGAGGVYLDGFEFHTPLADTVGPQILAVGLTKNNTVQSVTTISGEYGLYVRARDLVLDDVYYLPPHKVEFSVDGGPVTTTWEFEDLPGGADRYAYVNDYHVAPPTCGNYSCRDFYIDLGFTTAGQRVFTNVNGPHTVNVTVYDYAGNTASGSFTWTVTGGIANTPPVANPQSVATAEDATTGITLTGSDAEGDSLTFSVQSGPSHGTLSGVAPNLTYTPAANYNGADSFIFVAYDGTSNSAPATVSITVSPVNDAPVAVAQAVATEQDAALAIALAGTDVDGDALTYNVTVDPTHGSLSGTAPNLTYAPSSGFLGADSFTFIVNDGAVDSNLATVSIVVNPVNHAPVADTQSVTTAEDAALGITLTGSDPDQGDVLSFSIATGPSHGTLSGTAPNLTYTPAANFNGADSFTFKVNDGTIDSAPAAVSVTVTPVNDAPVANSQSVVTQQGVAVAVALVASDVDGDALTYSVAAAPANGTLSGDAPDLTYTPAAGYIGTDAFTFAASDGMATSDPATVSITVNPAGPVTVFFDDFESDLGWTRNPNGTDTATLGLWERADPEAVDYYGYKQLGTTVSGSYDLVTGPLAGSGAGSYDIDGGATSIRSPNIALPAGRELTLSFSYYLANYTNSSSVDYLRVKVVGSTTQTVFEELGAADDDDADWAAFSGSLDSFGGQTVYLLIEAADADPASLLEAAVDDVLIVAASPNQIPVAEAQSVSTAEDSPTAITLTGSDADGDPLTYSVVAGPSHGSLSGTAPNLTYMPAANYNGPDAFTFVVNDGRADSVAATVSIDVAPVNDEPVAGAQSVTTMQDTATSITLTGSDVDGDALTFSVAGGPSHGTLSGVAPILTYTPASGYSGADSFTFVTNDGQANSAPATVSITVNPAVTGPVLYLGSSTSGTAGGIAFADEDILIKDMSTGAWSLLIDGSDIGLANTDIDAFELLADGSLLLSFDTAFTLSGFTAVDDSDIVRFTPTSTGATTAGTWSWYFDGSDVGLSTSDEDVDAFTVLPDGRLLISTLGNVSVTGASGADEDLLVFTPAALGSTTSGTWAMYFDGSDVGLSSTSNEDINGVWVDAAGKIYLTTLGAFGVTGVSGDGSDVFVCAPSALGSTTRCTFTMYWDGSANGFSGEVTDSLGIVQ